MARTIDRLRERLRPSPEARGEPGRRLPGRLRERLTSPVDAAGLAVFRVGFGGIIAWEVWRAFDGNLIRADYEFPRYLFKWWLFQWVRPLPGVWLYVAFAVLGLAAAFVALGLFYRAAAIVTCAGITYWTLLEKAVYLNHRYLAAVFAFLLIFVPAHAAFSLDARRKSSLRSDTVPAWSLWLMRFQVGVPYFFAGVAKLNFDWLVRAEPLRSAMALHTDFPLIGRYFANDLVVHLMAWGSAGLDLSVPFLMLHRRTRAPAFGAALVFHFLNSRFFEIGIFPWMMILATTLFFDPDWPRRMARALRSGGRGMRAALSIGFALGFAVGGFLPETFSGVRALVGGVGVAVLAFHLLPERLRTRASSQDTSAIGPRRTFVLSRPLAAFLVLWVAVQILVPLRHFVIPGNVNWTEEGQRFAWHMLLRVKTPRVTFWVTDRQTGRTWPEITANHLSSHQIAKLYSPDLILEFAHYLENYYRGVGRDDVRVRVGTLVSLNGRPRQRMIYSYVDLTEVRRPYIPPGDWIVPLEPYRD